MKWSLIFSREAAKDAKKISQAGLKKQTEKLLKVISEDTFKNPPQYEKLTGNLKEFYSRRINLQHRLVYEVFKKDKKILILRMWIHYDSIKR